MSTVRAILMAMAWIALIGCVGLYIVDVAERRWVLAAAVWSFGIGAMIPATKQAATETEPIPRGE